jgi:hypothetical protein
MLSMTSTLAGPPPTAHAEPSVLQGWPVTRWPRALAIALIAAVSCGIGVGSLLLQRHYADAAAGGADLGRLTQLLADGSGPRTSWEGWTAAVLIAFSTLRVRRGSIEPPRRTAGRGVAGMRAALRREYDAVRGCLSVVAVLGAIDGARLLVYAGAALTGSQLARDDLGWILVEAAGLWAAAAALLWWTVSFRERLRQVSAL